MRSVAAWETGESDPALGNLIRLAEVLETSVGWLIGELPADGGAVLNDAALRPVWPLLSEKTLRQVISDLSQHEGDGDSAALMHLERVVGELRTRSRAPVAKPASAVTPISSTRAGAVAVASMDDAARAAHELRESSPKPGAAAPSASKPGRGSGAGKAS